MKIITDINDANQILQFYVGAHLQVAIYNESLKRIAIRLSRSGIAEVVYFVGITCESMNGHFTLLNVNLYINKFLDKMNNETTVLSDKMSGFELVTTGGFSLAVGVESEFGISFDNFLLDKS